MIGLRKTTLKLDALLCSRPNQYHSGRREDPESATDENKGRVHQDNGGTESTLS